MEKLLGFGNGARTATAKVGKNEASPARLVGFANGAKTVSAKVGKTQQNAKS